MVNCRSVICVVAALIAVTASAPAPYTNDDHYDQRQNGTENYRLNIDGIVVAAAPVKSLLEGISLIDIGDFQAEFNEADKPKPPPQILVNKPVPQTEAVEPEDPKPIVAEKLDRPFSGVTVNTEMEGQKRDTTTKPPRGQRLQNFAGKMLLALLGWH